MSKKCYQCKKELNKGEEKSFYNLNDNDNMKVVDKYFLAHIDGDDEYFLNEENDFCVCICDECIKKALNK